MKTKSTEVSQLEPIAPTKVQRLNCELFGWSYDAESLLFYKGDKIGYFTPRGFFAL